MELTSMPVASDFAEEDLLETFPCAEIDRLVRKLVDLPPVVWCYEDGVDYNEDPLSHRSLHEQLIASRGQPAMPPVKLWTENPFGDDAA